MNIDTDTQYAFTRPVVDHMFKKYDEVLKVDGEVGNKKAYDPRTWGAAAEKGMAARVVQACTDLALPRQLPESTGSAIAAGILSMRILLAKPRGFARAWNARSSASRRRSSGMVRPCTCFQRHRAQQGGSGRVAREGRDFREGPRRGAGRRAPAVQRARRGARTLGPREAAASTR
jgi:hypothetical protein